MENQVHDGIYHDNQVNIPIQLLSITDRDRKITPLWFREVADVQTSDMLNLPVPALRGGKPIIVESEPDWYVKHEF